MKRLIALLCLLLVLSPVALAGGGNEDSIQYAVVYNPDPADRLNLRVRPDTGSISLGKFYSGTPVRVREVQGEWAYALVYEAFEGWMHTDYLVFGEAASEVESAMPTVTITAPAGKKIFASMLSGAETVAALPMGSQLEVMGVMEDWLFVRAGADTVGFIENSGTMPRIYFSFPEATPPARVSIIATPTPSPTLVPSASAAFSYAPVEGARNVTEDDWIIFAAIKKPTTLYADKALTQPIDTLQKGALVRIFNDIDPYATLVIDNRIAGYFPSVQNFTVHVALWPFHVDQPSAAVENPIPSDRLHLREAPDTNARSLGRYYNGTVVTLLNNFSGRNAWTHVDIRGVQGYMKSEFLTFSPDLDDLHPALHLYEIVNPNTGNLHLRESPSTSSPSLGLYENGTLVAVIGVTGDWVHVFCDGQTGFMLHRYLKTSIDTTFDPYQ